MFERPKTSEIPDRPGAYLFRDKHGRVIYVGKAKSLRSRVSSYFGVGLHPRTQAMVDNAREVDWILTESEVAALMLEYSLIKEHRPRFNVKLVDDKSYPFLAITRTHEWPRALVMRGKKRKGNEYFGPYAHTYAIRKTLDQLLRTFPVRTCSNAMFERQKAQGRPCLLYHIEKCSGPCIDAVSRRTTRGWWKASPAFLSGDTEGVLADLEVAMWEAAEREEFELAARYRDRQEDVKRAMLRQEVVTQKAENFDLIAHHGDELETAFQVLNVRRGRVVGERSTIVDRVEVLTDPELMGRIVRQLYGDTEPPREVLVSLMPDEVELLSEWLTDLRGGNVSLRVPQRGAKRRLMETASINAAEAFGRHRLSRQKDHNARAKALRSLQEVLGLTESPLRIEAYDISTLQGTNTVSSMVVLEDGLPRRNEYRGSRSAGSTARTTSPPWKRPSAADSRPTCGAGQAGRRTGQVLLPAQPGGHRRGSGPAGAGGEGARRARPRHPRHRLAKKMEEVYMPGRPEPIRIPRDAEALYLLQQVRDEAHRFANTYHQNLRSKSMVDSILDEVPGVGPRRKKDLLRHFGSLKKMRSASEAELGEVVPETVAADLYAALHS
jgi:excinuclease ABC subunit C